MKPGVFVSLGASVFFFCSSNLFHILFIYLFLIHRQSNQKSAIIAPTIELAVNKRSTSTRTPIMSTNAVVGGHYGSPLDGSQPQPPSGLVPTGPPDHTGTGPPSRHDVNEILQQIMNITDQSLDEAQAR